MLTIGVDAHKHIHVAVALDAVGREVGQWRGANAPAGWQALAAWAAALDGPCQWGIEGAWNYGRGLAQHLVATGATVDDVNPRLTADGRRRARRRDKSDRLDARAVARAVQQEEALPAVTADDETAVLDLLVTEREDALAEVTRLRNHLHRLLLQLDPTDQTRLPKLRTKAGLRRRGVCRGDRRRPPAAARRGRALPGPARATGAGGAAGGLIVGARAAPAQPW